MSGEAAPTKETIGIVGGLGPHAHIELERLILEAAAERLDRHAHDQDYPEWIVSSIPGTPDRTTALLGLGPSPVPELLRSLARLAGSPECPGAGFAVMPCNTAHAYLDELRQAGPLPILDMIEATVAELLARLGPRRRVGVLGATQTCRVGIYPESARALGVELDMISLLDLPAGEALQERLVMDPIFGPRDPQSGARLGGGIKSGALHRPGADELRERLREAVHELHRAGAELVVCGCTEIPLALGRGSVDGTPLVDPMAVIADRAVAIAYGDAPLPEQ